MSFFAYRKLVSEYYDLGYPTCEGKELAYWLNLCKKANGPALEIGCGTGRVLLPLQKEGMDIMGIYNSPYMLEQYQKKCKEKGIKANAVEMSMYDMQLETKFGLIFLADCGLGMLTTEKEIQTAFTKVMEHLAPGGMFAFGIETTFRAEGLEKNNGNWIGGWEQGPEETIFAKRQVIQYDPDTHVRESLLIMEKFQAGKLVGTESNLGKMRFFDPDEPVQFLTDAGFSDIERLKWCTDEALDDMKVDMVSFRGRKA